VWSGETTLHSSKDGRNAQQGIRRTCAAGSLGRSTAAPEGGPRELWPVAQRRNACAVGPLKRSAVRRGAGTTHLPLIRQLRRNDIMSQCTALGSCWPCESASVTFMPFSVSSRGSSHHHSIMLPLPSSFGVLCMRCCALHFSALTLFLVWASGKLALFCRPRSGSGLLIGDYGDAVARV